MEKRILFLKSVGYSDLNETIRTYLDQYKEEGTRLDVRNLSQGPKHLEYLYYQAAVEPEILRELRRAEQDGYDAAIISCFDDPCLYTAREISRDMVITAPAESSVHLAATLGDRFSIIVGRDKWIPEMRELVGKYGLSDKLASFRSLGLGVLEFHEDEERTAARMRGEIRRAVEEDRAEVIILGCTMQFGFFRELQAEFSVPVIDSMIAALKYAEYLLEVKEKTGWTISRRGLYERPSEKEMEEWGME